RAGPGHRTERKYRPLDRPAPALRGPSEGRLARSANHGQGGKLMGIFNNPARDEQGNELRRRRTDQIPFSIIASDMTVIGDLETEGVVRGEGRGRGTVRVGAQVLVSVGAVIEGDLHTLEAVVAGTVTG